MNRKHNPWVSLVGLLLGAVLLVLTCSGCAATEGACITALQDGEG